MDYRESIDVDLFCSETTGVKGFDTIANEIQEFYKEKVSGLVKFQKFPYNSTFLFYISTHGMVKKTDKVPKSEIEKAKQIRTEYLEQ